MMMMPRTTTSLPLGALNEALGRSDGAAAAAEEGGKIGPDDHLMEVGFDSIQIIELRSRMEVGKGGGEAAGGGARSKLISIIHII